MPTDLESLVEMGFSQNRAQRALAKTNYKGLTAAMDWIEAHENDPDIDDEFIVPEGQAIGETSMDTTAGEGPLQAKSLKCDECGKLLKSEDAAQMHAVRSGHSQFSESVEEIKPLTEEERQAQMQKAQELLKQKRLEREEKEKKEQLEREKQRRVHGKEMIQAKQKIQDDEMKKLVDERKREKDAEKLARQRVKDQIEKDKLERAAKFGAPTPAATSQPATPSAAASSVQAPATSQSQTRDYKETNLQIRLLNGDSITQKFNVTEPLASVRLFVHGHLTNGNFLSGDFYEHTFATTFPRKVFNESDMLTPLRELGLVPSAVLMLTKTQRQS